ncbi:hypothetical protein STEG23_004711, partial [Scotinomys teguina]
LHRVHWNLTERKGLVSLMSFSACSTRECYGPISDKSLASRRWRTTWNMKQSCSTLCIL